MSDPQPTIELHQERNKPETKPAPMRVAAPADPAPVPEIITTITLKPGAKITIEYPA